jgi:outer membrane protein OmpA-like peptidoglycan-associated protein
MQTVYFTADNYYRKDLRKDESGMTHLAMYRADVASAGKWTNIVEMPFNNKNYSVGHPTLSPDNKTLYFISDIPGGYGMTDIYKVDILGDGNYGHPINLGGNVNSSGKEMFPFMSDDNFLYFSSDKGGGMGYLDIYAVRLDDEREPFNLGAPINSYRDDFAFLKKNGADYGYFSSNREEGKGDDDIYYFKELKPLDIPCDQVAEGIVTDKESGDRIPGALVLLLDSKGNEIGSQVVRQDAKFSFDVDCKSGYTVIGTKENYSKDSKVFTSNAESELGLELGLSIKKEPIVSVPVVTKTEYSECQDALDLINNIYFDLNKSYIRPDAASELDKVVRIMKRCPNIDVDATSHTDSRASTLYNEALSQRRAQATVDYIIEIGRIAPERIKAIGYGESKLRNHCADGVKCSEAEHQMNRRTQFEISNY